MDGDPADNPLFGATCSPNDGGSDIEARILHFDLHTEQEQLKRKLNYQESGPTGRTLVKDPGLRTVLIALRADARLQEHHGSGPIPLQIVEGTIRMHLPTTIIEPTVGQLLAVESGGGKPWKNAKIDC